MKIALLGYGKMGQEIASMAQEQGHEISLIIDNENDWEQKGGQLKEVDVAIDFSTPLAAIGNIERCFDNHIPLVIGTTGWYDAFEAISQRCIEEDQTLFYATNFSIGVNILFAINRALAKRMNMFPDYEPCVKEVHHTQKLDAPSGTAITLLETILEEVERKNVWTDQQPKSSNEMMVCSQREGDVTGIHSVIYESPVDVLMLTHEAKSRKGFVKGSLIAAEYCLKHKGLLTMQNLLDI